MRFVLIDKILELEPGKSIVALKKMNPEEELFKDHFPGFPVVPGVLLTEMMAQAAGKCLEAENKDRGKPMLARIKSASFNHWVRPGEEMFITVNIKMSQKNYATAEGAVTVNDKKVCKSELFFGFLPYDQFAPDCTDGILEEFLRHHQG